MNITGLTTCSEVAEGSYRQIEDAPGGPVVPAYPHLSLEIWRQYSALERIILMDLWINDNPGVTNENPTERVPNPPPPPDNPGGSK